MPSPEESYQCTNCARFCLTRGQLYGTFFRFWRFSNPLLLLAIGVQNMAELQQPGVCIYWPERMLTVANETIPLLQASPAVENTSATTPLNLLLHLASCACDRIATAYGGAFDPRWVWARTLPVGGRRR